MHTMLHELVRPTSLDGIVGQPKAVGALRRIGATTGHAGRAYWITGKTGQGKTTLARIIAAEVAEKFCTEELCGGQLSVGRLREIAAMIYNPSVGRNGGWAIIVNEAHQISALAVGMLKGILEPIPPHAVWVFTTTREEQEQFTFEGVEDAKPMIHRCIPINLTTQGLCKPAASWLKGIAESRGLDGQPVARYERLFNECGGSFRAALERIEGGCMLELNPSGAT